MKKINPKNIAIPLLGAVVATLFILWITTFTFLLEGYSAIPVEWYNEILAMMVLVIPVGVAMGIIGVMD